MSPLCGVHIANKQSYDRAWQSGEGNPTNSQRLPRHECGINTLYMKQWFIRRFIITEETCTIGVPSANREGIYTGFQGGNKSPYKPPFHHITYIYHLGSKCAHVERWQDELTCTSECRCEDGAFNTCTCTVKLYLPKKRVTVYTHVHGNYISCINKAMCQSHVHVDISDTSHSLPTPLSV